MLLLRAHSVKLAAAAAAGLVAMLACCLVGLCVVAFCDEAAVAGASDEVSCAAGCL
jgi:hypothetical protein